MLSHDILEANAQIQSNEELEALGVGLILSAGILEAQRSFTEQMEMTEVETVEIGGEEIQIEEEEEVEVVLVRCCILLEDVPITECLRCPAGHTIHRSMADPFIGMEFGKDFDTLKANRGRVKCPFENCEEHFQQEDLEMIVSPEVFGKVLKMKQRFDDYSAYLEGMEAGQEQMEESIRQQFMKADGSFSGFACPRCSYGPIDLKACDDLSAHQNQRITIGVRISNKCPQCFYFNHSIHTWKKWDGSFLSAQQVADIRDYRDQAAREIQEAMQNAKDRLCNVSSKKREFMAKNGFHARSLLMAQIRGNYTVQEQVEDDDEEDESEDIEVIDANEQGDDNIQHLDDPQTLIRQIEDASGDEKNVLSGLMMKSLLRAKNNNGFIRKWEKINRRQKKAGSDFTTFREDYETAISNAMAVWAGNNVN